MNDLKGDTPTDAKLLREASNRLKTRDWQPDIPPTEADSRKLLHELQVRQIELEMQNEELNRSQEELRKSRDKLNLVFDVAPVGYFSLTSDGTMLTANLAGADLLGVTRSKLIGKRFPHFVTSCYKTVFNDFLNNVFACQETRNCELMLTRDDQQTLFVRAEAIVCKPEEGEEECLLALADITASKQAKDLLLQTRDNLEQIVKERTEELFVTASNQQKEMIGRLQALEELRKRETLMIHQSRMAAMGEMLANIAHQWRQPLNVMGLLVQQIELFDETGVLTSQKLNKNLSKLMNILNFLSQTIDDFRNFSQPDKEKSPFQMEQVVAKTIHLVEDLFKNELITIEACSDSDAQIIGFPNELGQVLMNLLMNARDAFNESGAVNRHIFIKNWMENDRHIITVTDNAGGIRDDIIEKIFDAYFTTKETGKGSGVGLFMAKVIIESNMGGHISVRNTDNGAEFRIEV